MISLSLLNALLSSSGLMTILALALIFCLIVLIITWIRRSFLISLVKFILLVAVVVFGLCDYRLLTLNRGTSTFFIDQTGALESTIEILSGIADVEYYEDPLERGAYMVFVSTLDRNYLMWLDEDDIKLLTFVGALTNANMKKIQPIPFYIDLIAMLIIAVVPIGKRRTHENNS